jgi:cytoplasmic iron level regulating protein YaaA (DUF328/UPF0246 family)
MLFVISPAKTLDYDTPATTAEHTRPDFVDQAGELVALLRPMAPGELGSLMHISDALAALNAGRYASWTRRFSTKNAKQAVLAFNGDVYEGLDAPSLNARQLDYLQAHLRILSGLYGLLRPLDLMQPYRLEMGTRLANANGKDLYAFWGARITEALKAVLARQRAKYLVNLASEEYFKAVKPALLRAPVITPVFEDWKGGKYKVISFHAKRARGLMTRFAALHAIREPEGLKAFNLEGYAFDARASNGNTWMFRRRIED